MKVEYVQIDEQLYYEYADKLLLHVRELVELENGLNFEGNTKVAIVLDDAELATFTNNRGLLLTVEVIYIGHDVLLSKDIENILKENNIKINIIPDYYYGELRG